MLNISRKIVVLVTIIYSFVMLAISSPGASGTYGILTVPYYLFVPGYNLALLLREEEGFLMRILYSIFLGLTVMLSLASITQIFPGLVFPFGIIVPIITIVIGVFVYVRPTTVVIQAPKQVA